MEFKAALSAPLGVVLVLLLLAASCSAWSPDSSAKHYIKYGEVPSNQFPPETTEFKQFFKMLDSDMYSILVGGRNALYNISLLDLKEELDERLEWQPTRAHRELCLLKGKNLKEDCQNYVRIAFRAPDGKTLVCGTNAYKPRCRHYHPLPRIGELHEGDRVHEQLDGIGLCPFDPRHNSTAIFTNGQMYAATTADFSGNDALIYRDNLRTEQFDLSQLNDPSFIKSMSYGDYVFFFFRETAVEYMNCGKAVYSRVGRVCANDLGGSRPLDLRWTSFQKARLNCSIEGEYPFYFDEIQSTSDIISGVYGDVKSDIVYGIATTPVNSIGGSAVCAFSMKDIAAAFDGDFKGQKTIDSNWLPVEQKDIPQVRPGVCVENSQVLPFERSNFAMKHPLMESAVPSFLSKPLLVRVSLQYRFSAIAVHPQVKAVSGIKYDVIYVGTDDGKIIKALNAASGSTEFTLVEDDSGEDKYRSPVETVVISETQILPLGVPVKQIHVSLVTETLVVISNDIIKTMPLHHCSNITTCSDCLALQDPHCAWDFINQVCAMVGFKQYPKGWQDIPKGSTERCNKLPKQDRPANQPTHGTVGGVAKYPVRTEIDNNDSEDLDNNLNFELVKSNEIPVLNNEVKQNHEPDSLTVNKAEDVIYTADTLRIAVLASCIVTFLLGFVVGYLFSRRFRHPFLSNTTPFHEQHNHLNRLTPLETPLNANPSAYLPPRANKTINLVVNVPAKQDNLQHELGGKDRSHECKNSNESLDKDIKCGTLQKVKKTYI